MMHFTRTIGLFSFFLLCSSFFIAGTAFCQNGVGVNTNTPLSSFEDNGSFGKVVTTITASTTLDATHSAIVCNNGATAIAVTLPAPNTCTGRIYEIKRNAASTAIVTVTATIDGATNYLLNYANQSITVFSDGTNWQSRDGSGNNSNWLLTGNSGTTAGTNFLGTTDAIDLVFRTNGVEAARIASANRYVGIGTTTPTNGRLAVVNNGGGGGAGDDITLSSYDAAPSPAFINFSSRGTEAAPTNIVNGDQLFGIYGNGRIGGAFPASSSIVRGNYKGDGTTNLSDLSFHTSTVQRMLIDENGRVGIGNNSVLPTELLQVFGFGTPNVSLTSNSGVKTINYKIRPDNTAAAGTYVGYGAVGTAVAGAVAARGAIFVPDPAATGVIEAVSILKSSGNVGVSSTAPNSKLEVNGSFGAKYFTTAAATLTLDDTYFAVVYTGGGATAFTLPDPTISDNRIYIISSVGGGTITLNCASGNQFYALTTVTSANITITTGNSRTFISDGTNWRRIQ